MFFFFFKLYIIVLVLSNSKMNPLQHLCVLKRQVHLAQLHIIFLRLESLFRTEVMTVLCQPWLSTVVVMLLFMTSFLPSILILKVSC